MRNASKINANLPVTVDAETTFVSVGCTENGNKVSFVYTYRLKHLKSYYPESFQSIRQEKINFYCTNPSMAPIKGIMDVEYKYFDSINVYIDTVKVKNEDC